MLLECLKLLYKLLLGSLTVIIGTYIIIFSAQIVINLIIAFLYGGGYDNEE